MYTALFIVRVAGHPGQNLWDFLHDYYAVKAFFRGLNPYDVNVVAGLAGVKQSFAFVYTPLAMIFFAPFTLLSYKAAQPVALVFYVFVLAGTFMVCSRRLLANVKPGASFFFFAVLAFNGAINKSIQTGNVASLETALVFAAILCWLNGRHRWFLLLIFTASIFKLTPLFFLGLTFFDETPRWRSAAISCVAFLFIVAISFHVVFSVVSISFADWLGFERSGVSWCQDLAFGFINPSIYCLLAAIFTKGNCAAVLNPLITVAFALWCVVMLFITVRAGLCLARQGGGDESRIDVVVLALLCYALVLPRFQDYSWVLLIPAVFRVLMVREYAKSAGPLMVLCLLPQREDTFPGLAHFFRVAMMYSPVLVAFGAWLLLVLNVMKRPSPDNSITS